jgi:hypothetical protein
MNGIRSICAADRNAVYQMQNSAEKFRKKLKLRRDRGNLEGYDGKLHEQVQELGYTVQPCQ